MSSAPAASMLASAYKLYVFAGILCTLYAADTVLVAYNYRFYSYNPPSSKLLLLAEAVKLLVASCFYLAETKQRDAADIEDVVYKDSSGGSPVKQRSSTARLLGDQPFKALLVFAVPAVCYFFTNNLSFYALQIMSAHTYTLMCDLKVITTGVLSYMVLDRHLNRQAVVSLGVLFAGICIGQYATTATESSPKAAAAAAAAASGASELQQLLPGLLVMATIAMLSAVASVYTEWVMNFSSFRHESINLHNARMYVAGTLLNGLYYWQSGGSFGDFFAGMRSSHWAIVLMLAMMGLVTALLIKRYGTIIKVYASCVASLFAAGISHTLLHDPPAPLFYLGCLLAMCATLQLQRARSAAAEHSAGKPLKQPNPTVLKIAIIVPLAVSVLALVAIGNMTPAGSQQQQVVPRKTKFCPNCPQDTSSALKSTLTRALGGARADKGAQLMSRLPPFQPTCFVDWWHKESLCPIMSCSQDPSCTVHNTTCCAYFNLQMLKFFDEFMTSQCLQGEYVTVYGTLLGALRNKTILGHTQDVDIGLSLSAIQILERNETREAMWQQGYAFWFHSERWVWKMCPHAKHPSPIFRGAMLHGESTGDWEKRTKLLSAVYMDAWLMWPVSKLTRKCTRKTVKDVNALMVPWWATAPPTRSSAAAAAGAGGAAAGAAPLTPCSVHNSTAGKQAEKVRSQKFCLAECTKPLVVKPGTKPAQIANLTFPAPDNMEELMVATYGKKWRTPDNSYHGLIPRTPDTKRLLRALLEKLSLTVWGSTPWAVRQKECNVNVLR